MLWHFNCFRGSLPFYPDIIEMPDKIKGLIIPHVKRSYINWQKLANMHIWKHLDWVVKLIPCSVATIHTHIWKLALQQRLQICDILMIYRRIYYFDRHLQIYIYLYRALLKYANFAKSCQAKGKSWVMQGQVEKKERRVLITSCKDRKVCSQVYMTKWTMFSHGQTLWSHSHLCMITRYDHICVWSHAFV
jgi:hypothetical protein